MLEQESGLYYADLKTVPIPNHDLALLKAFPNVIVTPHTAFYTEEAVEHMVSATVKGLLPVSRGVKTPIWCRDRPFSEKFSQIFLTGPVPLWYHTAYT